MRLERKDALWRIVAFSVALLPLALALAVSFAVTPEDIEARRIVLSPPCAFRVVFGVDCPTCGLTRAFAALGHARFGDAVRYNAAAPLFYVAFAAGAVLAALGIARALADYRRARAWGVS